MFRILHRSAAIAGVASLAWAAFVAPAIAVTYLPSQTFKAGTRIACVLEGSVTSATAKYGDQFKLRVVDPAHPALEGSVIHGYITDVRQPAGLNRARIGFWLTSIHLPNGKSKPISATVLSRRVVQINPAAQRAVTQQLPPSQPYGTVTPGPIAWEMRIGAGKPSISSHSSPSLGGYVYGTSAHEPIVIPAGVSVTVELQSDLTIP